MERNGVETIESYRRKFKASFDDALKEWSQCARQAAKLKDNMPDVLFLSQNDLRNGPDAVAVKLAAFLERPECSINLTEFFRQSREDVTFAEDRWRHEMTVDNVDWSETQQAAFTKEHADIAAV
jgi:hypothetical protein